MLCQFPEKQSIHRVFRTLRFSSFSSPSVTVVSFAQTVGRLVWTYLKHAMLFPEIKAATRHVGNNHINKMPGRILILIHNAELHAFHHHPSPKAKVDLLKLPQVHLYHHPLWIPKRPKKHPLQSPSKTESPSFHSHSVATSVRLWYNFACICFATFSACETKKPMRCFEHNNFTEFSKLLRTLLMIQHTC